MKLATLLSTFEDKEHPLLGPNIFSINLIGTNLKKNNNKLLQIFFITIPINLIFLICMFADLSTRLNGIVQNYPLIPMVMSFAKQTYIFMFRRQLRAIVDTISEIELTQLKYENRDVVKYIKNYNSYARNLFVLYNILMHLSLVMHIFGALSLVLVYYKRNVLWVDGVEQPSLLLTKYPFDKTHTPGFWYGFLLDVIMSLMSVVNHGFGDTFMVTLMIFFAGQFRLLRYKCSLMFDEEEDSFKDRITECHLLHLKLMTCSKELDKILSPLMFFYFTVCSISLAALAFEVAKTDDKVRLYTSLELTIAVILQLLLFYWHSNEVLLTSTSIIDGALNSKWYLLSIPARKDFLLFLWGLKLKSVYRAGPFHMMTTSTFLMIIKSGYSFYTLLDK